uniref:Uncharacterized protein n=1 Tax=Romanomermis culicivorax TaxID=13658 RepID=A0A915IUE4_ROMCU
MNVFKNGEKTIGPLCQSAQMSLHRENTGFEGCFLSLFFNAKTYSNNTFQKFRTIEKLVKLKKIGGGERAATPPHIFNHH